MTSITSHQDTPIIVSNYPHNRKAHQARSNYLAGSVATLRNSIREILSACTNRFKVQA